MHHGESHEVIFWHSWWLDGSDWTPKLHNSGDSSCAAMQQCMTPHLPKATFHAYKVETGHAFLRKHFRGEFPD